MRDHQAASCLDGRTRQVVIGLERFDGDVESPGNFLKGVADSNSIPMSGFWFWLDAPALDWNR